MDDSEVSGSESTEVPLPACFGELLPLARWVNWQLEPRDGKLTKVPLDPRTGRRASTTDPATWADYETARQAQARYRFNGVGIVFIAEDDLLGIDLDHCRHKETEVIEPWAREIIDRFGSYTEVSPSGTGIHILLRGHLPPGSRRKKPIEVYDRGRFFTVTGAHVPGTPRTIRECSDELVRWHGEVFGASSASAPTPDPPEGNERGPSLDPDLRELYQEAWDHALLRVARDAENGDKFVGLFDRGAWQEFGYASQSEADLALVTMLAFWTDRDRARIDRLFSRSALFREKWNRATYRDATIAKVLDDPDFRSQHEPPPANDGPAASDEMPPSSSHGKGTQTQADLLIALADGAQLFHTPDGTGYARVPVAEHVEAWPVRSSSFRRWLGHRFFIKTKKAPSAQAMIDALRLLEAWAQFAGDTRDVFVRVGRLDDALYVDLANAEWEAIKITRAGWQVVSEPPIAFRRARGMLPLPIPQRGGSLDALRDYINLGTDDDWRLVAGWLVGAVHPTGPYPVLAMHAEQGAAKSTTQRLLRALIDPNTAPLCAHRPIVNAEIGRS
jgi:hypothetical protein